MMRKVIGFLAVLAALMLVSSPVLADDDGGPVKVVHTAKCKIHQGVHFAGHVTKTVVVRAPVAVLETGGDAARVAGDSVGHVLDGAAGLWSRTGNRAFGLFRR